METVDALIRLRAGDDRPGLAFDDGRWTHAQVTAAQAERASLLADLRRPGPFHVAVLLDNVPEYVYWLGAAALAGAVVVGTNPTHRGDELVRDLTHTQCQLLVTSTAHLPLVAGRELGDALGTERVLVVDGPGPTGAPDYGELLAAHRGAPLPDPASTEVTPDTLGLLLFTSGTSGAPKACRCTQGRLARIGAVVAQMFALGPDDVCYLAMPLFHSNALMAGWAPALAAGAAVALRERFSPSRFLDDVRSYGATYFNYVGKPLSYVLATPEQPDDAENPLRRAFGNEAAAADVARFAARFGCHVQDAYGSTEGGASVQRTPDTPRGALGRASPQTIVVDPATGKERPRARFDERGRLVNAEESIGELVNTAGATGFEGYWCNDAAEAARLRDGWYWTGDLAYRDEAGFVYFAGRDHDWLRVDGENFAVAPVESVLQRFAGVVLAAVYAVPDERVGDQVMAALELSPGTTFDPDAFAAFLAAQDDLGTKWAPRFVRVGALPVTATTKVVTRQLRADRWRCSDPVWWRPGRELAYRRLTPADVETLEDALAARGAR